ASLLLAGPPTPRRARRPSRFGTPLRGFITAGRSPHAASGPPSKSLRYAASRLHYCWPVPPRRVGPAVQVASVRRFAASLLLAGPPTPRRAHRPSRFGTPLRGLITAGRSPHAASGPPSKSLRYAASRAHYGWP